MSTATPIRETPMPGPVATYSPERFNAWFVRHKGEPFSPQFNTMLVRTMCDPDIDGPSRFMAWLTLYAAGNHSDWPVHPNGREKYQADCARETGMDRRRVSEAVQFCATRGWLILLGTRMMIQADGTERGIEGETCPEPSDKVTPNRAKLHGYVVYWLNRRPDKRLVQEQAQSALTQAQAILRSINLEILHDWERERETWEPPPEPADSEPSNKDELSEPVGQLVQDVPDNVSGTVRTNGTPIIRTLEVQNTDSASSRLNGSKQEGQSVSHQGNGTDRPTHASYHERTTGPEVRALLVQMLTGKTGETPKDHLCRRILAELKGAPLENLERRIVARYEAITSMGMCLHLAQDCGAAWIELQKAPDKQKKRHQEVLENQWRDMVAEVRLRWSTLSAEDRLWYHEQHPEEFPA